MTLLHVHCCRTSAVVSVDCRRDGPTVSAASVLLLVINSQASDINSSARHAAVACMLNAEWLPL